jgi:hypothetical protein
MNVVDPSAWLEHFAAGVQYRERKRWGPATHGAGSVGPEIFRFEVTLRESKPPLGEGSRWRPV